jgi:2-polyprenyl-3-methyl-5-hydroxy-6-metoxy-1,4-benzoquinol methylase
VTADSPLSNRSPLAPLPSSIQCARETGWKVSECENRACPVCGTDEGNFFTKRPDGFDVVRCPVCQLYYLQTVPGSRQLAEFYNRYDEYKSLSTHRKARTHSELTRAADADIFIQILRATGGLKGKQVCEIGSSDAAFLELARHDGANVLGVELDDAMIEVAATKNIKTVKEIPKEKRFDVICAFHVFEHLIAPQQIVCEVAENLNQDGRVLLAIPNGGQADLIGPTWVGFRCDLEHLQYYSIRSLSALLGEASLYVEHFWTTGQPILRKSTSPNRSLTWRLVNRARRMIGCEPANISFAATGEYNLIAIARKI